MPRPGIRNLAVLLAMLALAACAPSSLRRPESAELAAQQAREDAVRAMADWGLVGRISFDDGRDNGSGRIEWQQRGQHFEIILSAPVSRRSWRLSGGPDGALLEGLEGGPRRARSAEALLAREVGWSIPLGQLRAWARGLRAGPGARLAFGEGPLPAQLLEDGWTIDYRDWFADRQPPLPRRVFAAQGERTVRLVVERWLATGAPAVAGGAAWQGAGG